MLEVFIGYLQAEVGRGEAVAVGHDHGTLDAVLELAHIAWPLMRLDGGQRVFGERRRPARIVAREALREGVREQRGVTLAVAQGRNLDDDLGQSIVKVFAEVAGLDLRLEITVRGADDAHIHRDFLATADALDLALLEETQQLGLQRHRQVADLVEEQGAAVRGFDLAECLLHGTGESPLLVAEQLALEQGIGDRRTVDGHEALTRTRRQRMQAAGEDLLARPALAEERDGHRCRCDLFDRPADLEHARVACEQT